MPQFAGTYVISEGARPTHISIISRIHMFVPVGVLYAFYPLGGHRSLRKFRVNLHRRTPPHSMDVQERPAHNVVQGVCRPFQPCTSAQTNSTAGLTLTRSPTFWGARGQQGQSRGPARCLSGVSPKQRRAAEGPALTNKTRTLHEVLCRPPLYIGRA